MVALIALLLGCTVPDAEDPSGRWVGTYQNTSGCRDGRVTLDLAPDGGRWRGTYHYLRTDPPPLEATYDVVAEPTAGGLWMRQVGLVGQPDEANWCRGEFQLTWQLEEVPSPVRDWLRRFSDAVPPAEQEVLEGTWIAYDCQCGGAVTLAPIPGW